MLSFAGKGKPKPIDCRPCNGTGTVPVDPSDPRKGERACSNCGGLGTVG